MMNDGLIEVVLSQEWLGSEPGTAVRVDPQRAQWLSDNGYERQQSPAADEAVVRSTRRSRRAQRDEEPTEVAPESVVPEPIEGEES